MELVLLLLAIVSMVSVPIHAVIQTITADSSNCSHGYISYLTDERHVFYPINVQTFGASDLLRSGDECKYTFETNSSMNMCFTVEQFDSQCMVKIEFESGPVYKSRDKEISCSTNSSSMSWCAKYNKAQIRFIYKPTSSGGEGINVSVKVYTKSNDDACISATDCSCMRDGVNYSTGTFIVRNYCFGLDAPADGSVVFDATTYGATADYKCDRGYSRVDGSTRRTCSEGGIWNGTKPTCRRKDCFDLDAPANGSVVFDATTYGATADYKCDRGYSRVDGSARRTCSEDGIWNGTKPTCRRKDCFGLDAPADGSVVFDATTYGATADYKCDRGYSRIDGSARRTCSEGGIWNGTKPTCRRKDCFDLDAPADGSVVFDATTYGATADYKCDRGYSHVDGSARRTCSERGIWNGTKPTCRRKDCFDLDAPADGSVVFDATTYGATADYKCDRGYSRVDGSARRTCSERGIWNGTKPTCRRKDCFGLDAPADGSVVFDATTYGATADYKCDRGYSRVDGSARRTCSEGGIWNGTKPTCRRKDCFGLDAPADGSVVFDATTYGATADYKCDRGYRRVDGSARRTCSEGGIWNGTKPTCRRKDCFGLDAPADGSVVFDATTYGATADYKCDRGYSRVDGSARRTCSEGGIWNGKKPTCRRKDCFGLDAPADGSVVFDATTYGATADYKCDRGYSRVDGSARRTCSEGGIWNGTKPTCRRKAKCSASGDPHYTTFDGKHYDFQGACTYTLARDASSAAKFDITVDNVPCGTFGATCTSSVVVRMFGTTVRLLQGMAPIIDNYMVNTADYRSQGLTITKSGLWIFLHSSKLKVTVQYDKGMRVFVHLGSNWKNNVEGLCGNYDGRQDNEFNGYNTAEEFGNTWKTKTQCPNVIPSPSHTCNGVQHQKCALIKTGDVFGKCRQKMDDLVEDIYYQDCLYDACRCDGCDIGGDCECLCTALGMFAEACNEIGVPVSWRNQSLCPLQCDNDMVYTACGSPCPHRCQNIVDGPEPYCDSATCVEGCFCPSGYVQHDDACIPTTDCPCMRDGDKYPTGTSIVSNCMNCTCVSGKFSCTRKNCTGVCADSEFVCDNGDCISNDYVCDGVSNCHDESDEICKGQGTKVKPKSKDQAQVHGETSKGNKKNPQFQEHVKPKQRTTKTYTGVIIGIVVLLTIVIIVVIYCYRKRRNNSGGTKYRSPQQAQPATQATYQVQIERVVINPGPGYQGSPLAGYQSPPPAYQPSPAGFQPSPPQGYEAQSMQHTPATPAAKSTLTQLSSTGKKKQPAPPPPSGAPTSTTHVYYKKPRHTSDSPITNV